MQADTSGIPVDVIIVASCVGALFVLSLPLLCVAELRQKAHADRVMSSIPVDDVESTLAVVRTEAERYRARRKWVALADRVCRFGTMAVAVSLLALHLNHLGPSSLLTWAEWLIGAYLAAQFLLIPVQVAATPTTLLREAVDRLRGVESGRAVGVFAELAVSDNSSLSGTAADCLTNLLPTLTAADGHNISSEQMACLCRCLDLRLARQTAGLQVAILRAFEQIGGADEIPRVEALTFGNAWTDSQAAVRNAAEDCLVYLRQNAVRDRERMALLRPLDESVGLLRPVTAAAGQDAGGEQLLHIASEQ